MCNDPCSDNFTPVRRELTVSDLTATGALPANLRGTLYRNGPNPQFARGGEHWFTGDGMVHAIEIESGKASYTNRWVRTPKWQAERRAGRAIYTGFGGSRLPDAPDWAGDDSGSANTSIIWHGGRLLALEEAHPPTELEPRRMETKGYYPYGPERAPFTAHPKIDPLSGEMLFFGYNAAGRCTPAVNFGIADKAGSVRRFETFEAPFPSMIHDFMITESYALFPILPLTGSLDRVKAGRPPYAWEPDRGAHVGIMRRDGSVADISWFSGNPCYVFHVMNAWEDGTRIIAEVMAFPEPPLFPRADGGKSDPTRQRARLTRWTFDLAAGTNSFVSEDLDDLDGEFPRIDERFIGRLNRHGWHACSSAAAAPATFDGLAHHDRLSGRRRTYFLQPGDALSEPVFAPSGAEESDGYLLSVAWRAAESRSELLVFSATDIDAGPIAAIHMPQRVPFGFHGCWVSNGDVK